MAPELFEPEVNEEGQVQHTYAIDIFALSNVVIEVSS
jgi:hypothetical protein